MKIKNTNKYKIIALIIILGSVFSAYAQQITVTGTPLTAFVSVPGIPSAEQSYFVEGSNLTDDITITAPADFEISLTTGTGFGTGLLLTQTGGTVASTEIFVRFNRATEGISSGDITHESSGATTENVTVSGEAITPVITITGTPLSAFTSSPGVPSAEQSYFVEGSNLTDDITITAPADFEISLTTGTGFGTGLLLTQTGGTVASTEIFVRFNRATEGISSGDITHESSGATTENVTVSGEAITPVITITGTPLSAFTSSPGVPSAEQSYFVEGSNLTDDITITAPADFEISLTTGTGFGTGLLLTQTGGTVASTEIFVRFNRATEGISSGDITHESAGATTENVTVSGEAITPVITITGTPLSAFTSSPGVPSAEQSYFVEGSNLTDDITITAPADFEISLTTGTGFGTGLLLTQTGGTVASTEIFVRFNRATEGISSGDITHESAGATTENVTVSGEAITPVITITGTPLSAFTSSPGVPSAEQSYFVEGSNLTDDITITAPADFEISLTTGTGFGTGLLLTQTGGTVASTEIFVRFNRATEGISSGDITHESAGATTENVSVSGEAITPLITLSGTSLARFITETGTPSSEQSYMVSGSDLIEDITITAPDNFEISETSGIGFTNQIILSQTGGVVNSTAIYVRLNPASNGNFDDSIPHVSSGAVTKYLTVHGIGIIPSTSTWIAYNDCAYRSTDQYKAPNVTTYDSDFGTNSGPLFNQADNAATGVTATLTQTGGVFVDLINGGFDPVAGTEAYNAFHGIADMRGVIHYGSDLGWWLDITFTGLDPNKVYNFVTSSVRGVTSYTTRITKYTISGVDAATNESSEGVDVINNYSVKFCTGDNYTNGYIAKWIDIQPGSDSSFTVRAEQGSTDYHAYTFDVFSLEERVPIDSPLISISGTPLTPFTSEPGIPSAEQSYFVSGSNLTDDITIAAPADFEISLISGSGFGSGLVLTQSGGSVPSTEIFVRFNRVTEGNSSGNISHTSSGASTKNVAVSGEALTPVPGITITGTPLAAFTSAPGVPSSEQSYFVSGVNLTNDITITAPADFEISLTSGSGFGSGLLLTQTGGSVSSTEIFVRFNRATEGISNGDITHESTGATTQNVTVSGEAIAPSPVITFTGTPLSAFTSEPGVPSAEQSYFVSGSNLTDDITITAPADFEVSLTSGSGFGSGLLLTQTGGSVSSTEIFVRFNRATEGISSGDITHESTGATTQNVAVSGEAIAPSPVITFTGTPLSAFTSEPGVPSAEQSYFVSGSNLTDDITITAPADFEVSLTSGSGFGSGLLLTQTGGSVSSTEIFVRFNRATEGISSGDITHESTGATTQNVAVSGEAIATHFQLDLTVFLQGPFNGSNLNSNLNPVLPFNQPYNIAPWNYTGTENVASMPAATVDWILIELRDAPDAASATPATSILKRAAFINSNGQIVDLDGVSELSISSIVMNQLFVVIWQRNHLAVMSANPMTLVSGTYQYDFTIGSGQAYGTDSQAEMVTGIWGMIGGDENGDGTIDVSDKTGWINEAGNNGYLSGDFDMNSEVNNTDKNDIWLPNSGKSSQVPN